MKGNNRQQKISMARKIPIVADLTGEPSPRQGAALHGSCLPAGREWGML